MEINTAFIRSSEECIEIIWNVFANEDLNFFAQRLVKLF